MKVAVAFEKPVYKNQGTPAAPNTANLGKLIAPGDVVTVAIRNAAGAETPLNLTVTDVLYSGTTIQFDTPVGDPNLTIRAEDIVRVHAQHQYRCPQTTGKYQIVLTQSATPATDLASVTSIVFNGAARQIGAAETGTPAAGFTAAFISDLTSKLNTVLNGHGYATVTATAGAVTILINGTDFVPGTVVAPGFLTPPATWTVIP